MENMDKGLTVPKWLLIVWPKIPGKCPKICMPNLSAQAQKFGISLKKASLGVRSPCLQDSFDAVCQIQQWYFYNSRKTWSL